MGLLSWARMNLQTPLDTRCRAGLGGLLPLNPFSNSLAKAEPFLQGRDNTLSLYPFLCQDKLRSFRWGWVLSQRAHPTFMTEVSSQVASLPSPSVYN